MVDSGGFFLILDSLVTVLAIIGNLLVLECSVRKKFGLPGYRKFLINLLISELYLCITNAFVFIYQEVTNNDGARVTSTLTCGALILRNLQLAGFLASLLSLVALSLDHFIGVVYPLRYFEIITTAMVGITVAAIWSISAFVGLIDVPILYFLWKRQPSEGSSPQSDALSDFAQFESNCNQNEPVFVKQGWAVTTPTTMSTGSFSETVAAAIASNITEQDILAMIANSMSLGVSIPCQSPALKTSHGRNSETQAKEDGSDFKAFLTLLNTDDNNFCTFYSEKKISVEVIVAALTALCLVFLTVCYGKIFQEAFSNFGHHKRFRKLFLTTITFCGAFAICFLPFMTFEVTQFFINNSHNEMDQSPQVYLTAQKAMYSLLLLYPLFVPLIYVVRMKAFREYFVERYWPFNCSTHATHRYRQHRSSRYLEMTLSKPTHLRSPAARESWYSSMDPTSHHLMENDLHENSPSNLEKKDTVVFCTSNEMHSY